MRIGNKEYAISGLHVEQNCRTGEATLFLAGKSEDGDAGKVKFGYDDWKFFMDLATTQRAETAIGPETYNPDWRRWINEIGKVAGYVPRYRMEAKGMYPDGTDPRPGPHFNCAGDVVVPKEEQ